MGIAVLHLDGDLYGSYLDPLFHLYDLVAEGGVVICDDCGHIAEANRGFSTSGGSTISMSNFTSGQSTRSPTATRPGGGGSATLLRCSWTSTQLGRVSAGPTTFPSAGA